MAATRADLLRYRRTLEGISESVDRALRALWRALPDDPAEAAAMIRATLPEIIASLGDLGADAAADFYDTVRAHEGARDNYRARPAASVPLEQIHASAGWALAPMFREDNPDREEAFRNTRKATERLSMTPGRQTLLEAAAADPLGPRFARIPNYAPGRKVCRFCVMLASRGAVYHSRATAGEFSKFHDGCYCTVTPIYNGEYPDDYDPDFYYDLYRQGKGFDPAVDSPPTTEEPEEPEDTSPWAAFKRHGPSPDLTDEVDLVNPFYALDERYKINCQACTAAVEMRARGFDVEAILNDNSSVFRGFETIAGRAGIDDHWRTPDGKRPTWSRPSSLAAMRREVESWPEGARGFVGVAWKGNSAHIFNVEKRNGKAVFLDGQPDGDPEVGEGWSANVSWRRRGGGAWLMRSDNLIPQDSVAGYLRPRGTNADDFQARYREARIPLPERRERLKKAAALREERREWMDKLPFTRDEHIERRAAIVRLSEEILRLEKPTNLA